jgi:hypothetical protein
LKIEDNKTKFFLQFSNFLSYLNFNLSLLNPSTPLEDFLLSSIFIPSPKIIIPTFFVLQDEARFVVTRNNINDIVTTLVGGLASTSNEQIIPQGVKNMSQVTTLASPNVNYCPPIYPKNALIPAIGPPFTNFTEEYYQGVNGTTSNFVSIDNCGKIKHVSQPLFTAHYVLIKNNLIQEIYGN